MNITKRDGSIEVYTPSKIIIAISKSFISTENIGHQKEIEEMALEVECFIKENTDKRDVESIQDRVEKTLMKHGFFDEAKSYILFRWQRNEQRKYIKNIAFNIGDNEIEKVLNGIRQDFRSAEYSVTLLSDKFMSFSKPLMTQKEKMNALIKAAVELTTAECPKWEMIAGRLLSFQINRNIDEVERKLGISSFYDKIRYLTDEGLYGGYILENYSKEDIAWAEKRMDNSRNYLFNYSGLDLLSKRYLIRTFDHKIIERIQEMYMGIALHLAMPEKENRLSWVGKIYDLLSKLEVTMATPTLSNARKPSHQLSSCFIDTVPDSLIGIYRSIDNFAQVSKFGGGMGMYFGKVRATGGDIRGFKGVAGGVIRWMKLVNDTAVAVDQLGMRQGAVAVYLDVWHKDIPEFLQLRTNNGDDRMKAHDIFPAVCYPDLFIS